MSEWWWSAVLCLNPLNLRLDFLLVGILLFASASVFQRFPHIRNLQKTRVVGIVDYRKECMVVGRLPRLSTTVLVHFHQNIEELFVRNMAYCRVGSPSFVVANWCRGSALGPFPYSESYSRKEEETRWTFRQAWSMNRWNHGSRKAQEDNSRLFALACKSWKP